MEYSQLWEKKTERVREEDLLRYFHAKINYVVANKNTKDLPIAAFSASSTVGTAPLTVKFTDNSINAISALWYFGFFGTSTEKNPTFNFTSPGKYRVVLAVSNARGYDATAQEIIVQRQQRVIPALLTCSENSSYYPPLYIFFQQMIKISKIYALQK